MTDRREFITRSGALAAALLGSGEVSRGLADDAALTHAPPIRSIQSFGVTPDGSAEQNTQRLQDAIGWAHPRGGALLVEPTDKPYPIAGGLVLKRNVSLLGVHGPVGRGTRHPDRPRPAGSVFAIEDENAPLLTVEGATQIAGLQFWYPAQTRTDPDAVIAYPPTIQVSHDTSAQGVTLRDLSFFGEFTAMDFRAPRRSPCEQILIEHCYGYPLSGQFVMIERCYDIPRILHCHVNPGNRRYIDGDYRRAVIDAVVRRGTFAYHVDHADNVQMIDTFTFGTYGGAYLGPGSYGQLTNFNYDCVTVGIHKLGDNDKNRNWQIGQGSIIANTGAKLEDVHPILVEGRGHTALSNVEAFSGENAALSDFAASYDVLHVRGEDPLSVSLLGCRMHGYTADEPITINNPRATVQAAACFDAERSRLVNFTREGEGEA